MSIGINDNCSVDIRVFATFRGFLRKASVQPRPPVATKNHYSPWQVESKASQLQYFGSTFKASSLVLHFNCDIL